MWVNQLTPSRGVIRFFLGIFFLTSTLCSAAMEWGWRANLDIEILSAEGPLKRVTTHKLHENMYLHETQISPYVVFTDHPANICMGALTVLVQCSPELVSIVTIPVQDEVNKQIIFCSQKESRLYETFPDTEGIIFSPDEHNPKNVDLRSFLETLGHSRVETSIASPLTTFRSKRQRGADEEEVKLTAAAIEATATSVAVTTVSVMKKTSKAGSESGRSSVSSGGLFALNFQHTEQKLVYYLLKNDGSYLRDHIHKALMSLSSISIVDSIDQYYGNIIGLMLHVHTRLDPCENCVESLVLFRKKALSVLNTPEEEPSVEEEGEALAKAIATGFVADSPIIDAPVLVTVSSRSRHKTIREIAGYDEHWKGTHDIKDHGHMAVPLKSAAAIKELVLKDPLEGVELIHLSPPLNSSAAVSGLASSTIASSGDIPNDISANCHGIFPDLLQRFAFL